MAKTTKEHSLTGRITPRLMLQAFQAVKRNRGAAGVDKVSVKMFEANLADNLGALMRDLKKGSLIPRPVRRVLIEKSRKPLKLRPLGIPVVRDRVAQETLRRLLSPIFERLFHDDSFGFRKGRSCHQALRRALKLHRLGHKFVLSADIRGFFDNISHDRILKAVAARVADGNILGLVGKFLKSGVMQNGVFKPTTVGTPQGSPLSPLLANVVLNHLDWRLHDAGFRFVRYADDFIVLCRSQAQAQEALALVSQVLEDDLGLQLNRDKTIVTTYGKGYSFLGFDVASRWVRMRAKSVTRFKDKVRELSVRKHNLDRRTVEKLNRVVRGTAQYFAADFANCRWQFQKLDSWIRMRLRCMKMKRKSRNDNYKLRVVYFRKNLGLLSLEAFCSTWPRYAMPRRPSCGAISTGVAR